MRVDFAATAAALWRLTPIMIGIFSTVKPLLAAVLLAVTAAELENDTPGAGAAKRERAAELLMVAVDPWLPEWLDPVIATASGFLIDAVVALANRTGFFARLGES